MLVRHRERHIAPPAGKANLALETDLARIERALDAQAVIANANSNKNRNLASASRAKQAEAEGAPKARKKVKRVGASNMKASDAHRRACTHPTRGTHLDTCIHMSAPRTPEFDYAAHTSRRDTPAPHNSQQLREDTKAATAAFVNLSKERAAAAAKQHVDTMQLRKHQWEVETRAAEAMLLETQRRNHQIHETKARAEGGRGQD